jgi:hypothetical protein
MSSKWVMKYTHVKEPGQRRASVNQQTMHSPGEVTSAVRNLAENKKITKIVIDRVEVED